MTLRAAILSRLTGDAALMTALAGGLYDAGVVGVIGRERTPSAFDSHDELRPAGLLRIAADTPTGPLLSSSRQEATIYLYQSAPGTSSIETARERVYALLHRVRLTPSSGGAWELRHAGDVLDLEDDTLNASLIIGRYVVLVRRPYAA